MSVVINFDRFVHGEASIRIGRHADAAARAIFVIITC